MVSWDLKDGNTKSYSDAGFMANFAFPFFERAGVGLGRGASGSVRVRFARPPRAGGARALSSACSGLGSRGGAAFRFREVVDGGPGGAGGGGGAGWLAVPAERLAAERVTLDDMSNCTTRRCIWFEAGIRKWPGLHGAETE
jgi:hypothetical protein